MYSVDDLVRTSHTHIKASIDAFHNPMLPRDTALAHAQLATAYSQLAYLEVLRQRAQS